MWRFLRSATAPAQPTRPHTGVAHATSGQTTAVIDRAQIPDLLSELVVAHTGTGRSIGVLSVRIAAAGSSDFEFAPHLEDFILATTLQRLRTILRTSDRIGVIAKHELCVILPMISGAEQAELAALKLLRELVAPIQWQAGQRELRATIGIACSPAHGTDSACLVRAARSAAQIAETKEDSYHVFAGSADATDEGVYQLESELRSALHNNDFHLAYQPQIELATGALLASEALARWTRQDGKPVSPAVFIPLAERRGLIGPFTEWSLNTGLRQLASFREAGIEMSLSVNVSPINLSEPDLPEVVAATLGMWSIAPEQLTLEITESTPMHDTAQVISMLNRLKAVGVRLAIDDFGTGYSSLSLLRQLPVDELKIDQQFVRDMLISAPNMQIVRSVLDLANNFGLKTVAEGVEDEATLDALRDLGCTLAQGYFIARPLAGEAFIEWHRKRAGADANAATPTP